jgi:hypothetical protein
MFCGAKSLKLGALGFRFILFAHGNHVQRHPIEIRERLHVGMIADDQRNVARQLSGAMAVQQIDQAMVVARNKQRHPRTVARKRHAPLHPKARGDGRELFAKSFISNAKPARSHSTRIRNRFWSSSRCSSACRMLPLLR